MDALGGCPTEVLVLGGGMQRLTIPTDSESWNFESLNGKVYYAVQLFLRHHSVSAGWGSALPWLPLPSAMLAANTF